ncbi:unnamed protein product [Fasciola hepatica]|uniref:Reverse transcriptase domain-containing protein n=1 Tax=Fasciola hepatica TaxID=6192 RepID=A0ABC9HF60_FASHE
MWYPPEPYDIDQAWEVIRDEIVRLCQTFAPPSRQRPHAKGPPWFDSQLRRLLKHRNRAWKQCQATGEGYDRYRNIRNQCTQMKREKRRIFEETLAMDSVQAPKRLFAYLRRRTRTTTAIPALQDGHSLGVTDEHKAEILARHYLSVYAPEQRHNRPSHIAGGAPQMSCQELTEEEVAATMRTIRVNQSPGPDGVHPLVVKELADVLTQPVTRLFNASLAAGKLPQEWRKAVVVPLYKGGANAEAVNYRPVSLTPVIGKVMERLLATRIRDHIGVYDLLSRQQHGFWKNRSCLTNLVIARERWTMAKAEGHPTDVIFVDFSKAFDKVLHDRLLGAVCNPRASQVGIRGASSFPFYVGSCGKVGKSTERRNPPYRRATWGQLRRAAEDHRAVSSGLPKSPGRPDLHQACHQRRLRSRTTCRAPSPRTWPYEWTPANSKETALGGPPSGVPSISEGDQSMELAASRSGGRDQRHIVQATSGRISKEVVGDTHESTSLSCGEEAYTGEIPSASIMKNE